jgi:Uncharacterized conserved protein (DUF2303)
MSDPQPIIDVVKELGQHAIIGTPEQDKLALAVLPEGRKIESLQPYLDKLRAAPRRVEANAKVTTVESFIAYLNRFKLFDSAIFASDDAAKPSLFGVVDFHGGTGGGDSTFGSDAVPRFGVHTVRYEFPLSDQIGAWSAISGQAMSHAEMATFLADREFDIANPPLDWMQVKPETIALLTHLLNLGDDEGEVDDDAPDEPPADDGEDRYIPRSALYKLRQIRFGSVQRMTTLARNVEVSVNAKATAGYNPKTGERTVSFTEEHETHDKAGRRVIVPDAFLLRAPVFEGETPQLIPVRLQYRQKGGTLSWFMTLVEWRRVVRFAVKSEADRVQKATGLPVFYGARQAGD